MFNKSKLGELLVQNKVITKEQLETALEDQKKTGEILGITLLRLGFVDEESVYLPILAQQFGVEFVHLKERKILPEAIGKIPAQIASHYKVIPVEYSDNTLKIAMTKPLDVHVIDEIGLVTDANLKPVLASEKDIQEAIRKYYGVGADTIEKMMDTVQPTRDLGGDVKDLEEIGSDATISKFLNQILLEAYKDRATDIHVEPFEDELKIRYRVDGVLYDTKVPSNIVHFKDAINSRIKILSNLNIAEKRLPQDGRFKVRVGDVDLDLRVSFMPCPYGESAVLRILNAARLFSFAELGLTEPERKILEHECVKPNGIIFMTGPTGSGKTTTLYSCLARVNTVDKKIITIEDPIEYQLKGITQVQINPPIGLTFASGLRSMLRHDPDIMMVGEVRDIETAEIAIRVALTGHLVFSTLHTNDAASSVTRLLDMGVEPYLISSSVNCVIAQRLVRVVCQKCKQPAYVKPEVVQEITGEETDGKDVVIYEGKGCESCWNTGYVGRQAIYEFLVFNDQIRNMVLDRASSNHIKEKAIQGGMKTLRQAGWQKVLQGVTTPSEVIRVSQEVTT
jgi:type II secretory ATPase GspE/PulE/Tfp pilus assembly ATPase PilB-like protein